MSCSRGFSIFLALALLLSLSLKVLMGQQGELGRPDVQGAVTSLLTRQAYRVQMSPDDPAMIEANLGQCRMLILEADPAGGTGDALRTPRKGEKQNYQDQIAFVFEGRVYSEQPTLITAIHNVWIRAQHRLRIHALWQPVLAIRASHGCSIDELPWVEIARLPGSL